MLSAALSKSGAGDGLTARVMYTVTKEATEGLMREHMTVHVAVLGDFTIARE